MYNKPGYKAALKAQFEAREAEKQAIADQLKEFFLLQENLEKIERVAAASKKAPCPD